MTDRARAVVRLGVAVALSLVPALALAPDGGGATPTLDLVGVPTGEAIPPAVRSVLGAGAERLSNGMYRISIPGPDLFTHGPDFKTALSRGRGTSIGPGDPERQPVCSGDANYQRVIYARGKGAPALNARIAGRIRSSMRRANALLNQDALESGGVTADYKVLCDSGGDIAIGKLDVKKGSSFKNIVLAAMAAGNRNQSVDYTIFSGSRSENACGAGTQALDTSPLASNRNNNQPRDGVGAGYAVIYVGCWDSDSVMHENGHNEGAVQPPAPFSTGNGLHCYKENDVMCYSPDGGNLHQQGTVVLCAHEHFDCGSDSPSRDGDTYFDTAPERGSYLATHWNIGSPVNRFIAFNAGEGGTRYRDETGKPGSWAGYKIQVRKKPRKRSRLAVSIYGPACDRSRCSNDPVLYVRRGGYPNTKRYACRLHLGQSCVLRRPKKGTWYYAVRNYSRPPGVRYDFRAKYTH